MIPKFLSKKVVSKFFKNYSKANFFSKVNSKKIRLTYRGNTLETSISGVSINALYTTITLLNPTTFQIMDEDCFNLRIEMYKRVRFDLDEFSFEFTSGDAAHISVRFTEVFI